MSKAAYPSNDTYTATTATTAADLIIRYTSNLGLKAQGLIKVAQALAEKTNSLDDLAGRSPVSVAAACIYMASHLLGIPKTAKEVGLVTDTSDGTIRTVYKFLYAVRDQLIEPSWIENGKGRMENLPPV